MKTNFIKGRMDAYPNADTTTAAAVMVLVTGGRDQKTSMVSCCQLSES